jgi:molybdopterin molybdotransferase
MGAARANREFFAVRTVADALAGFRPARRTAVEPVALARALGRVPAADVEASAPLPGFARSTVDGYAVHAADTYGASEGLPSYLEVRVVMVEHTQEAMAGTIEVVRPVAPGENVVGADEDVIAGATLAEAGRPLRAGDLALLAAAGVTTVDVHRRPRVAVLSTGDEVVDPGTARLAPGQVRDAIAVALCALVREAGGDPDPRGIVRDDRDALAQALEAALADSDVVVVSAGSSVGMRDQTAAVVAGLGEIFCHGLALRPGKPTLLADCGAVPLIGLPGNPRSALVVFRLVGMPVVRLVGGCALPPPEPVVSARLARDLPSATGRLDVVQVAVRDGIATPLLGPSALLSILRAADGYLVIPEEATGLDAGAMVDVTLYR